MFGGGVAARLPDYQTCNPDLSRAAQVLERQRDKGDSRRGERRLPKSMIDLDLSSRAPLLLVCSPRIGYSKIIRAAPPGWKWGSDILVRIVTA